MDWQAFKSGLIGRAPAPPPRALPPEEPASHEFRVEPRISRRAALLLSWTTPDGIGCSANVVATNFSSSGFGGTARDALPPGLSVEVSHLGPEPMQGVVRHCSLTAEGTWRIGVRLIQQEDRRWERLGTFSEANLSWASDAATMQSARVRVENVSQGGVRLRCDAAVEVGAAVRLSGAQSERVGIVRYCERGKEDWALGIEFAGDPPTASQA